ncbi:MAG: EamA family transporter [Ruminococcaceae bacterium]|nr:EamA family transporter [Oscillospiraceae bacterium]
MAVYYIATIAAMLIWAASYVFTDICYGVMTPIQVAAVRSLITTEILALVLLVQKLRQIHGRKKYGSAVIAVIPSTTEKHTKGDMAWVYVSGLLGITLYTILENYGVRLTTTANSALVVASFPAMTVLFEFLIYKMRPTFLKSAGILLAIVGVGVLTGTSSSVGENPLLGNLCLIVAGVTWAFYSFTTRIVADKFPSTTLTFYQMLGSTVFYLPFVMAEGARWKPWAPSVLGSVLFLCIGCSFAALLLYNFGLRKLSAGISAIFLNLIPVFGIVCSAVIAKENITVYQLIGGAVVIVGVLLSCAPEKKTK